VPLLIVVFLMMLPYPKLIHTNKSSDSILIDFILIV
jgi:hypothetical protein